MDINSKQSEPTSFDAVISLVPNSKFAVQGTTILQWDGPGTQPTESEIEAELTKLKTEYTNKKYLRDRAKEFPSLVDQLDDIYHNGIDGWKATIKATKDKYPKS